MNEDKLLSTDGMKSSNWMLCVLCNERISTDGLDLVSLGDKTCVCPWCQEECDFRTDGWLNEIKKTRHKERNVSANMET